MNGMVEDILTDSRMHLMHGTTTICSASAASTDEDLSAFLDCCEQSKSIRENMPHLADTRLEGPYFSPAQAGAQQPECMKQPTFPGSLFARLERGCGNIVRWSSASEVSGIIELGDILNQRGILPSIAHTMPTAT